MSSDALFQLGMVSVRLNASQTDNFARGSSANPNAPRSRAPLRRAVPSRRLPLRCCDRADTDLPPPSRLNPARQYLSLLRGQRYP